MRNGFFQPRFWIAAMIASMIGSVLGVILTQLLSNELLKMLLPILIACMAIYLLIPTKNHVEQTDRSALTPKSPWTTLISTLLGIYSGFLGAGTGSLWTAIATGTFKLDIVQASAISRFMCFITNSVALVVFISLNQVNYPMGITLAICGSIGAYFGSKLAVRWGTKFMRTMIVSSTLVLAGNLAVTSWF